MSQTATSTFKRLFGTSCEVFRAPGRVNLLGEHTDYNDGFVLPMALNLETRVAVTPRSDRHLHLVSTEHGDQVHIFDLDALPEQAQHTWTDYPVGVARSLALGSPPWGSLTTGANLVFDSTLPMGAGLSSSAALEVATALALLRVNHLQVPRPALARLCQEAENHFVGVPCGIMDPFVCLMGQRDHALFVDCRNLGFKPLELPHSLRLVVLNSQVHHSLREGDYAARRQECEQGVEHLRRHYPQVQALRDVEMWQLDEVRKQLPAPVYRRCRHVVGENERVLAAVTALEQQEYELMGALMSASHDSLRDDFEVSCRELDMLVDLALPCDGVLGTRMTGAGFGGCTVTLVEAEVVDEFVEAMTRWYLEGTGLHLQAYVCTPAEGASPLHDLA